MLELEIQVNTRYNVRNEESLMESILTRNHVTENISNCGLIAAGSYILSFHKTAMSLRPMMPKKLSRSISQRLSMSASEKYIRFTRVRGPNARCIHQALFLPDININISTFLLLFPPT